MEDDFFGMLGKAVTGFFAGIFKGAGRAGSRSGANKKIMSLNKSIEASYRKIGSLLYGKYRSGEISIPDDDIAELIKDIDSIKKQIEEYQKKLTK